MEHELRGDYARMHESEFQESGFPAGVLPPPEALRQYDAIVPGAAERIFRLAEDQAQYHYQLETARIKGEMIRGILAMCFSAAISILLVVGGIVIALSNDNRPESGIPFILFGVVLLAGAFIYINTRRSQQEVPQVPRQRSARVGRAYDPQGFEL